MMSDAGVTNNQDVIVHVNWVNERRMGYHVKSQQFEKDL